MEAIDNFLNSITMYRLVLYYLILLLLVAFIYSLLGILSFNPLSLVLSALLFTGVCLVTNWIFSKVFEAPTNFESVYISALILTLIVPPLKDVQGLIVLFWIGVWAMASKYILAINKKHIFNPAAFAVALSYFTINGPATWWVGTGAMLPPVLLGLLIVRKIKRFDLVFYFFLASLLTILGLSFIRGSDLLTILEKTFLDSPIVFFAFIMLTEPLTTPPTRTLQSIYGALVGFLFAPQLKLGPLYTTPEIALLIGNIYSYIVSPKGKLLLRLKERVEMGTGLYDFVFSNDKKLAFLPGQYMEWTLPHKGVDSRGNRRYFTLASSPTEEEIHLGVKFYERSSTFKKALLKLQPGEAVLAGSLSGDFTLPDDPQKGMVMIAGGVGITPFRSMIKFLLDKDEKRDLTLFYSNKTPNEVAYKNLLSVAQSKIGLKVIYVFTGKAQRVTPELVKKEVPDFKNKTFYLSGPRSMVTFFEKSLKEMGVESNQIKIDFFPGFA